MTARDQVAVGERRLDHHHVGALLHVEQRLAHRLAPVGRVHLVAAAVAERRRRAGRLAERPVEGRGELRRVGEDRRFGEALGVELLADRADAPVHHVRGRDHVGAGARVADGGAREQLERGVVVDRCRRPRSTPQWPWAVYSHRHTSVITSRSGTRLLDRARPPAARRPPRPTPPSPARPSRRGRRTASPRRRPSAAASPASATAAAIDRRSTPGIVAIGSLRARGRRDASADEQRQHELAGAQVGLAHEPAQRRRWPAACACASVGRPSPLRLEPRASARAARRARRCHSAAAGRRARARRTASVSTGEVRERAAERRRGAVDGRVERLQRGLEREHERDHADHVVEPVAPPRRRGTSARNASGSDSRKASSEAARTSRASAPIATPSAPNASAPNGERDQPQARPGSSRAHEGADAGEHRERHARTRSRPPAAPSRRAAARARRARAPAARACAPRARAPRRPRPAARRRTSARRSPRRPPRTCSAACGGRAAACS